MLRAKGERLRYPVWEPKRQRELARKHLPRQKR